MWAIWVKLLLPPALNGCPKSNKSPDLVALVVTKKFNKIYLDSGANFLALIWPKFSVLSMVM